MKVINASEFHRVELIVPVIKDLTYLSAFDQERARLDAEDPLGSYIRSTAAGEGVSLSHVLKAVDDDPLKSLITSTGQMIEKARGILDSINGALESLSARVEFVRTQLEKDEFNGGIAQFLETSRARGIGPVMQEWRDLCYVRRDMALPGDLKLPEELGTHHVPQVLLHSKTAWDQLEQSFKVVTGRFFSGSTLVKGKYSEDDTIDYSLIYTLFTNNGWQGSLPTEVNEALRPFCQRIYFGTVDGIPRFFEVV
jgi:hypothetical protein